MRLTSADEGFRLPPQAIPANWQENFFYIMWNTETCDGFMMHVQRVPGIGIQEARIVARAMGVTASATLTGPYRADQAVEGVSLGVSIPYRDLEIRTEFSASTAPAPFGFVATRSSGDTPVLVEARLQSELEPVDFAEGLAQMTALLRTDDAAPQMGDQAHYEQGGRWSGVIRVGDREVRSQGLFVRDHSWGIRHEHNNFRAFWTATCLDDGNVFCNAIGIPRGDGFVGIGALSDSNGVRFTREVAASFSPQPGLCSYDSTEVRYGEGINLVVHGESQQHWPLELPFSGRNRYDNNAISQSRAEGLHGFSVMEWATTLTDEQAAMLSEDAR
jgi:hypothetical protein